MRPWLSLRAWWGSPEALYHNPCLQVQAYSALGCLLSHIMGVPVLSILCSGLLTGFLGWTPNLPCKITFLLSVSWAYLCHKPIFSLLSWLCFPARCCHWLFVSPSLGLSMDSITTTSPVLFRQCGASFKLPSFPSFSPWRSPALSAPWWVAPFRIHVCTAPWELPGSLPLVKVWPFMALFHVPCSRKAVSAWASHCYTWYHEQRVFKGLEKKSVPDSTWFWMQFLLQHGIFLFSEVTERFNLLCDCADSKWLPVPIC